MAIESWGARRIVIERAVRELLVAIGEDPKREGLADTPMRVARFWQEFIGYEPGDLDTQFTTSSIDELVAVRELKMWSLCEHHLLPFSMDVTIGYLSVGKVIGLSKLARIAQAYAHRLQLQERFAYQVAQHVKKVLKIEDVAVVARGEHLCMAMRGVRTPGVMHTSVMLGKFRDNASLRSEFLALIK